MTLLFTPYKIGSLSIPNRLIRSATAERMASENGTPLPSLIGVISEPGCRRGRIDHHRAFLCSPKRKSPP